MLLQVLLALVSHSVLLPRTARVLLLLARRAARVRAACACRPRKRRRSCGRRGAWGHGEVSGIEHSLVARVDVSPCRPGRVGRPSVVGEEDDRSNDSDSSVNSVGSSLYGRDSAAPAAPAGAPVGGATTVAGTAAPPMDSKAATGSPAPTARRGSLMQASVAAQALPARRSSNAMLARGGGRPVVWTAARRGERCRLTNVVADAQPALMRRARLPALSSGRCAPIFVMFVFCSSLFVSFVPCPLCSAGACNLWRLQKSEMMDLEAFLADAEESTRIALSRCDARQQRTTVVMLSHAQGRGSIFGLPPACRACSRTKRFVCKHERVAGVTACVCVCMYSCVHVSITRCMCV